MIGLGESSEFCLLTPSVFLEADMPPNSKIRKKSTKKNYLLDARWTKICHGFKENDLITKIQAEISSCYVVSLACY